MGGVTKYCVTLTNGDLDEIGKKVQEVIAESWRRIEDHYGTFPKSVEQSIA